MKSKLTKKWSSKNSIIKLKNLFEETDEGTEIIGNENRQLLNKISQYKSLFVELNLKNLMMFNI